MIKILKAIIVLVAIGILLGMVGCAAQSTIPTSELIVSTATHNLLPTNTSLTKIETATPSTSVQTTDLTDFLSNCTAVKSQLQPLNEKGGFILYDPSEKFPSDIALMNISDGSTIGLVATNESLNNLKVSPNRQLVAFLEINKNNIDEKRLVIENFVTTTKIELAWDKDWEVSGLKKWLNNRELLIALKSRNSTPSFIVLNPFTNETAQLPSLFPNQVINSADIFLSYAYDPSLSYVVYPALENNIEGFALFDRVKNAQIAFTPSQTLVEIGTPSWSSDGQKYAFVSKTKLGTYIYVGNIEGNVNPIAKFPQEMGSFIIRSISWSPDNKHIAFIVYDMGQEMEKLMLLDLTSQKILDFCVQVNYEKWSGAYSDSDFPVWSPDGQFLIVENQLEFGKNNIIFIHLAQMNAGIFTKDVRVLGWIVLKP